MTELQELDRRLRVMVDLDLSDEHPLSLGIGDSDTNPIPPEFSKAKGHRNLVGLMHLSLDHLNHSIDFAKEDKRDLHKFFQDQKTFPDAGSVRIIRDTYGLPHIFASNEPDAMYGLGYATAQDRLYQIFTTMYTAEGRLTELTGRKDNLEGDILFRSFRFKWRAETLFNDMKPELRELASHYCRGINDLIQENRENVPEWITSFEPSDMMAIAFLMNARESLIAQ